MPRKPVSRRDRPAKSPLSRKAVVKTALALLEKEGLARVTMRRIATALDTGPASLYVYVRDTQELHALVLDALLADLPTPKPGRRWRADLVRVCEAFLTVLLGYPEIARMTMTMHATGPNSLRLLDTLAGLLLEGGASVRTASWGVDLVHAYVVASAAEHAGRQRSHDAAIEEVRQAVEALDPAVHPHLAKLGPELFSGEGPQRFRWGLEALVNGVLATAAR